MRFREQSGESEEDDRPFVAARTEGFDQWYVQRLIVHATVEGKEKIECIITKERRKVTSYNMCSLFHI